MKKIIHLSIALSALVLFSCSEEKKLIRKASSAVEVYDYDKAISYYDQILAKDSNNFYANAGKGVVLSEYVGKYDKAIPYLEKAIKKSPDKTSIKINNDLGKSYHYIGNYPRALYFYAKATKNNNEDNPDYDIFLAKRISDCKYALDHPEVASAEYQSVKNVGSVINTDMPEYGPVYTHGDLIFTSKRKDTPKEKKNGLDRRYFESMYMSAYNNGTFSTPRRFTIPDLGEKSKFRKGGESVVSASADGNTLYIFRGGKLYEANMKDSTNGEHILPKTINFSYLQGHAFVSNDGSILLFTSESEKGRGGTDIYKSVKDNNGKWSDPQLLPYFINTDYNEDAPFLTEDGTLFFASNGLPGYGGYDVYKTHFVNGQWTEPENLGQPINTPGDDIYFALNPNSSKGFYSSSRKGGYGDMDIYHVHYVSNESPNCKSIDPLLVISATQNPASELAYTFSVNIPEQYKNNVRSISWKVNDELIPQTSQEVEYAFNSTNTYKVFSKVIVYCDTCPALVAMCAEKEIIVGQPLLVNNIEPVIEDKEVKKNKIENNTPAGELNNAQLNAIGWNTTPDYFDFGKSEIRGEGKSILDQNINVLKNNRELTVIINGYADSRGPESLNMTLSEKRANSVRQYLIKNGISKRRITGVNAYGESKIENGCTDNVTCSEEQHQENRKVTVKVTNNSKLITSVSIE
ncbi:MAG: OmpA family protein [Bacteroidetes bacterium]|nr:OmpA family protein [Bacteroidota bacterium]